MKLKMLFWILSFFSVVSHISSIHCLAFPNDLCKRERSDQRCNEDEDCCAGKYCSAFGYCETR